MGATSTSPSKLPTAKVAAATAATAAVGLAVALVEWLAGVDVPAAVELPALTLATFAAGYMAPPARRGRHA